MESEHADHAEDESAQKTEKQVGFQKDLHGVLSSNRLPPDGRSGLQWGCFAPPISPSPRMFDEQSQDKRSAVAARKIKFRFKTRYNHRRINRKTMRREKVRFRFRAYLSAAQAS
ncbi:hypothetical protein [Sphingobium cloacae]|uniref:hypothetical protein n=1 Tax=Sphingobium cloacae TaxID=120107 RepID=UPI0012ECBAC2|nr:hypothetical protein [Sphingobium cloacae]